MMYATWSTILAQSIGLVVHLVVLNDDNDPLPVLAKQLGVTEERIGEDTVGAAGIIKKHLLVFFPDDEKRSRETLADALSVLSVNATVPDSDIFWGFRESDFDRLSASVRSKTVIPFLEAADKKNRVTHSGNGENRRNFRDDLKVLRQEIRDLYLADPVPWIIGYSGGKDSTAVVQLTWQAIEELPVEQRTKPIHVISTDTLVENPVVAQWVGASLSQMDRAAIDRRMPFRAQRLTPSVENTYWVNLIGKGYPAPRHKFRWCTERMKISPSNAFIGSIVRGNGEAILLLGTRKKESQRRQRTMIEHEKYRVRDRLSPNSSLPGTLVYSVIEDWTNDEVWMFLMQFSNPWGYNNKDLLTMYQGASADGECPLVVDTSTPSCGDSRFGCWVCTLVDKDKSMSAMVQNDEEKEWMYPLLVFRNKYLDFRPADGRRDEQTDRERRDFRRMNGSITIYNGRSVHGPYTQQAREEILFQLLKTQEAVRKLGRESGIQHAETMELITLHELEEIRRIWVVEKHEIEDSLPTIFEQASGKQYPGKTLDENLMFGRDEMAILHEVCAGDRVHYELARELLDVERRFRTMSRRAGLFGAIDDAIKRGFYENEEDATQMAIRRQSARERIRSRFENKDISAEAITT
ncbi:MAG: DNA phosphorothioation system sulfurtransferase DndC [Nibricoccus sp.]